MPILNNAPAGLVGTIGVTVLNADGTEYAARTTTGVVELGGGSYRFPDPDPSLTLIIVWDTGVGTERVAETLYAGRGETVTTGQLDSARADIIAALPEIPPPSDGVLITQDTISTTGQPLGRVMPYGKVTAYLAGVPHYQFTADADGDFEYTLPAGSTWRLVARGLGYRDTVSEVTT